jgi:mannosyltransferase
VTVGCWWWRERAAGRAARGLAAGWLAAAGAAVVLCGPLVWLCSTQRAQVSWIVTPTVYTLERFPIDLIGPLPTERAAGLTLGLAIVACFIAFGLVAVRSGGGSWLRERWPRQFSELCLPWMAVPPVLLFVVSFVVTPLYDNRYVLFCLPALVLCLGAALAAMGRLAVAGGLALILVLGVPAQLVIRSPAGHGENIRQADRIVAAHMRPGDAAIFRNPSEETWSAAYPYGFARLRDLSQAKTPAQAGNLKGTIEPLRVIRQRLRHLSRVWVVDFIVWQKPLLAGLHFRLVHQWRVRDIWVSLYQRH